MARIDPAESAARSSDVYVFYTDMGDVVGPFNPEENPNFRFLANLEPCSDGWRWSAIAIVESPNLYELPSLADAVATDPLDGVDDTAKPVKHGGKVLRSPPHFPNFGFARLRVDEGRASEVLYRIEDSTEYSGSAMVSGAFEILVEIGSDNADEVCKFLVALADIPGVTEGGVEAAQVTGAQYYYRPRKRRVGRPEDEEG